MCTPLLPLEKRQPHLLLTRTNGHQLRGNSHLIPSLLFCRLAQKESIFSFYVQGQPLLPFNSLFSRRNPFGRPIAPATSPRMPRNQVALYYYELPTRSWSLNFQYDWAFTKKLTPTSDSAGASIPIPGEELVPLLCSPPLLRKPNPRLLRPSRATPIRTNC